jgi:hypothetical protein
MIDPEWRIVGRASAWAYGGLAILGGVLVTIVSIGIPPTEPDLAKHYSYIREIWPGLYISFLLFLAAFLSLVPLGLALREFFGRSLRSELVYASFFAAAILGVIWMLVQVGSAQTVARDSAGLSAQDLNVLGASSSIWSGVINWLQRGFLLFAGLGTYWTGRIALRQRSMPRGLSWVSVVMAAVFAIGLASLVLRDLGVPLPASVGSLVIALGALLALVWAAWLGWALGRLPAQPRASSA